MVTGEAIGNRMPLAAPPAPRELGGGGWGEAGALQTCVAVHQEAAVGMAVIDFIERENLRESVGRVGAALKAALASRGKECAFIGDVRGHGLFIGVEIVRDDGAKTPDVERTIDMVDRLKEHGFL